MLLKNKNAVIYGGGGAIGSAVARRFAREGARVFLAGRHLAPLDSVAGQIREAGGEAEPAEVDALDEAAVDRYVDAIAEKAGHIDVSFNLISYGDVHGIPLVEMSYDDFSRPVTTGVRTQFLTTRAAARHMLKKGSGVILMLGGSGGGQVIPTIGGTQVAFDALEGLRRQWAAELSPHGIRVLTLQTGGIPETIPLDGAPGFPDGMTRDDVIASIEESTLLKRAATRDDVGTIAAFAASDMSRTMTATAINISCGGIID